MVFIRDGFVVVGDSFINFCFQDFKVVWWQCDEFIVQIDVEFFGFLVVGLLFDLGNGGWCLEFKFCDLIREFLCFNNDVFNDLFDLFLLYIVGEGICFVG